MLKKLISATLLVVTLLGINFQTAFAKSKGDWGSIATQVTGEVAVKTVNGETVFGKLTSANETEIVVQIADKKELTNQTRTFQKSEIKKVWRAELKSRGGLGKGAATAIGAGAGAGVGAGIGAILLNSTGGSDAYFEILGVFTVVGAGAGAVAGFFAGKGGHKKRELIYEI
jgi:hypothetical protein